MTPRRLAINLLWLLLAAVWLFPLGWTVLGSFKTSNVAIFQRPFALPEGITFTNYQQAIRAGNLGDYFNPAQPPPTGSAFSAPYGVRDEHPI